jgi:putative ABC transport system permease protein
LLVAAGLVLGLVAAWLVAELACRRWLVSTVRPELGWQVLVAVLGSALLAILVVVVAALRTTGQPIGAMLRQVPPRRSRLGLGVLEAVVGAMALAGILATSVAQLQGAVRTADPSGRYATPVIVQQPPGVNAEPVIAVEPAPFARIAQWGWSDMRPTEAQLARLSLKTAPPIRIKGTTLQLRMGPIRITNDGPASVDVDGPIQPVWLRVYLRRTDGSVVTSDFGPLVNRRSATTLSGLVSCAPGCALAQLGIARSPADPNVVAVDASVESMAVRAPGAMAPVDLHGSRDWTAIRTAGVGADDATSMEIRHVGTGLRISAVCGTPGALAHHLDVPLVLPALVAGPLPDTRDELDHLSANNVDGRTAAFTPVGQIPISPQLGARAMIVDLTLAARSAGSIADAVALAESDPMVWLGRDDDRREQALVATLAKNGAHVTARDAVAARRKQLSASAPAWSMQAITTASSPP